MWLYLVCIPYAITYYVVAAILSKKLNDDPKSLMILTALFATQIFGIWPIMARYSKNLIFDGQLYDLVIFLSYYVTMVCMGCGKNFTYSQWGGMILVLIGLLVLKLAN